MNFMSQNSKFAASGLVGSGMITGIACLLLSVGVSTAQTPAPPTPAPATTSSPTSTGGWEYKVENANMSNRQLETFLNQRGAEGWELICVSEKGVAVFKRPKK